MSRHPFSDRYQFIIDDQHAVVEAGDEAFGQYMARTALFFSYMESLAHLFVGGQIDTDAPAVVCVEWFNYHRVTDFSGRADRSIFGGEHDLPWHR